MKADLHSTRLALLAGDADARTEIERAIAAAESQACAHAFARTTFDQARSAAAAAAAVP